MDVDKIDEIFASKLHLSNIDLSEVYQSAKIHKVKKNEVIRSCNSYEKSLFYLLDGATGSVIMSKNKLVCIDICVTDEFFGDYQALITNDKSPLEIVAITNCTYITIPFKSLLKVYEKCEKIEVERIGRTAAEELYILKNKEILEMKTLSAKERYVKLLSKKPEIIKQIPIKYIAAYLGITSESLSRIRKEILLS